MNTAGDSDMNTAGDSDNEDQRPGKELHDALPSESFGRRPAKASKAGMHRRTCMSEKTSPP